MKLSQLFEFEPPKQSPLSAMVTPQILDAIERKLDTLYKNIGVDVDFSRHFQERIFDARNVKPITVAELVKIFTDAYKKFSHVIKKSPYEYQAVLTDLSSMLNVPFALSWNAKHTDGELTAKTIMRKKDFQTTNPKLVVEKNKKVVKEPTVNLKENSIKDVITEATAVYVKEIPEVYRKLPLLGKGMTSIVLDKGDGNVLMFTRDAIKSEWLTREWGIKVGRQIDLLDGFAHKKMKIREMPIYVIEMPKLFKLDAKNKRILQNEMNNWDDAFGLANQKATRTGNYNMQIQDAMNNFIKDYPNSPLTPIMQFMQNYDGYVNLDIAARNTLQDAQGNMIFVDPMVSKELFDAMRGR